MFDHRAKMCSLAAQENGQKKLKINKKIYLFNFTDKIDNIDLFI